MFKKSYLIKFLNLWPPYLGAGIRVRKLAPDLTSIQVEMKLHFWNRNYVGTHFGGSLYSMTDPFLMLMLIENLGRNYIVWDKAATIRYKAPGKGKVNANFQLSRAEIDQIRSQVDQEGKIEKTFQVQVCDENGKVVAEVEKLLFIRRKDLFRQK